MQISLNWSGKIYVLEEQRSFEFFKYEFEQKKGKKKNNMITNSKEKQ